MADGGTASRRDVVGEKSGLNNLTHQSPSPATRIPMKKEVKRSYKLKEAKQPGKLTPPHKRFMCFHVFVWVPQKSSSPHTRERKNRRHARCLKPLECFRRIYILHIYHPSFFICPCALPHTINLHTHLPHTHAHQLLPHLNHHEREIHTNIREQPEPARDHAHHYPHHHHTHNSNLPPRPYPIHI